MIIQADLKLQNERIKAIIDVKECYCHLFALYFLLGRLVHVTSRQI